MLHAAHVDVPRFTVCRRSENKGACLNSKFLFLYPTAQAAGLQNRSSARVTIHLYLMNIDLNYYVIHSTAALYNEYWTVFLFPSVQCFLLNTTNFTASHVLSYFQVPSSFPGLIVRHNVIFKRETVSHWPMWRKAETLRSAAFRSKPLHLKGICLLHLTTLLASCSTWNQ